jgi:hypothetical protein
MTAVDCCPWSSAQQVKETKQTDWGEQRTERGFYYADLGRRRVKARECTPVIHYQASSKDIRPSIDSSSLENWFSME